MSVPGHEISVYTSPKFPQITHNYTSQVVVCPIQIRYITITWEFEITPVIAYEWRTNMCCAFLSLVLLGPRIFGAFWWIFQPARWQLAFGNLFSNGLWWIWPMLGIVFLPWTTLMFVIVSPGGVVGWDWLWIGLMLVSDIASYTGGIGRKRLPGYQGY
jgi:hypothetical protein